MRQDGQKKLLDLLHFFLYFLWKIMNKKLFPTPVICTHLLFSVMYTVKNTKKKKNLKNDTQLNNLELQYKLSLPKENKTNGKMSMK
jgi:hypothetical protein